MTVAGSDIAELREAITELNLMVEVGMKASVILLDAADLFKQLKKEPEDETN